MQAPVYHTIEGSTQVHKGIASIAHSSKPCSSPQPENAYQVLHGDDVEEITNQYQELPNGECPSGVYRIVNADSEPVPYPTQSYHVVDRNMEDNPYHTLEEDSDELTADSCMQQLSQVDGSDTEHVYRTLEVIETAAEVL